MPKAAQGFGTVIAVANNIDALIGRDYKWCGLPKFFQSTAHRLNSFFPDVLRFWPLTIHFRSTDSLQHLKRNDLHAQAFQVALLEQLGYCGVFFDGPFLAPSITALLVHPRLLAFRGLLATPFLLLEGLPCGSGSADEPGSAKLGKLGSAAAE